MNSEQEKYGIPSGLPDVPLNYGMDKPGQDGYDGWDALKSYVDWATEVIDQKNREIKELKELSSALENQLLERPCDG